MLFRIIREEDYERVINHLRSSFFSDEPLNKAVQLCPAGEGHEELERQCVETMKDGYSLMALEEDEIFGVLLNGVLRPGDTARAMQKLETIDDPRFCSIFKLLYSVTKDLDIFNMFQVDSILEGRVMSVGSKARGKGLAGELVKRTLQNARDDGYKLFKADATGIFSQKICEKFGMETIKEVVYGEYRDPDTGLQVFQVPPPHLTLKIMVLRLQ